MKKFKSVEQKIEEPKDPNRMYSIEDKNEILRLFKVAIASSSDVDSIYNLYRKYIAAGARYPSTSCNCKGSVSHYWREIADFYSSNGSKFE